MCLYEVQTPLTYLYANRYIDITDFIENKKNILLSYKSQSVMFNSFIKIICYNKLAAIHLPNTNAAEFVRELSEEDIMQLIRRSNSINKDKNSNYESKNDFCELVTSQWRNSFLD